MKFKLLSLIFLSIVFTNVGCANASFDPTNVDYNVIFDSNEGKVVSGEDVVTIKGGTYFKDITKPTFTKEGFRFSYFSFDKDGIREISPTYQIYSDIKCFAQYSINDFNVTFDANGGELLGNNIVSVKYKTEFINVTKPIAKKENEKFKGWYLDKEGNEEVPIDYQIKDDVTVYASYIEEYATINFDPNGGQLSGSASITAPIGSLFKDVDKPIAKKENHSFVGWFLDSSLTMPFGNNSVVKEKEFTLYASYEINKVVITFNPQLGAIIKGDNTINVYYGTGFNQIGDKLPTCSLINHTFLGYSLDKSNLIPKDYIFYSNTTLYALYSTNQAEVTFDPNYNDSALIKKNVTIGTNFSELEKPEMNRTGYDFLYFTFDKDGLYKVTNSFFINDDITFYAQYEIKKITVTFDANEGNIEKGKTVNVTYGTTFSSIYKPEAKKDNHEFLYWSYDVNGLNRVNDSDLITENVTFYAFYKIIKVDLIFNLNNGEDDIIISIDYGTKWGDISKPENPNKNNYEFIGWSTISTSYYEIDENYVFSFNKNIYAFYKHIDVLVTFDPNGGTLVGESIFSVEYGTKFKNINKPIASKTDCGFKGWAFDENGLNKVDDEYEITGNITIYPIFEINKVTITFNALGGSASFSSLSVAVNTKFKDISKPTISLEDYELAYWSFDEYGVNIVKDDYAFRYDITLFAQYEKTKVKISFNSNNNGDIDGDTLIKVLVGTSWKNVNNKPALKNIKRGFYFVKWTFDQAGNNDISDDYLIKSDCEVFAQISDIVTLNFDPNGGTIKGDSSIEVSSSKKFKDINKPSAIRNEYKFKFWAYDNNGANKVLDDDTFLTDTTVYAIYKKTYNVTLNANGGSFTSGPNKVINDIEEGTILNTISGYEEPTKSDSEFLGWSLSATSRSLISKTTSINSNMVLYAQYETEELPTLTIVDPGDTSLNDYSSTAIKFSNSLDSSNVSAYSSNEDLLVTEIDYERNLVYVDTIEGNIEGTATITISNGVDTVCEDITVHHPRTRQELAEAFDFAFARGLSSATLTCEDPVTDSAIDWLTQGVECSGLFWGFIPFVWQPSSERNQTYSLTFLRETKMGSTMVDIKTEHNSYYHEVVEDAAYLRRNNLNQGRLDDEFPVDKLNKRYLVHNSESLFFVLERGFRPVFDPTEIADTSSFAYRAYLIYNEAKMWCKDAFGDELDTSFKKVRQLFEYLINHIHYDYWIISEEAEAEMISQGKRTYAYSSFYSEGVFLNNGIAVCDGFSKALVILSRIEGLDVVRSAGYIDSGSTGHAWNYYRYNENGENLWYLLCPTWAQKNYSAGSFNGIDDAVSIQLLDSFLVTKDYFKNSGYDFADYYFSDCNKSSTDFSSNIYLYDIVDSVNNITFGNVNTTAVADIIGKSLYKTSSRFSLAFQGSNLLSTMFSSYINNVIPTRSLIYAGPYSYSSTQFGILI